MKKKKIRSTAQVNLHLLAKLGVPEAVKYQSVFPFNSKILNFMPRNAILSIAAVAEILYAATNARICEINNPVILDLACGYGPRAFKMVPCGYHYIGGDLASVIDDIHDQLEKQQQYVDYAELFQFVDVTDRQRMEAAMAGETRPLTVVTQGLLTYLNPERKHQLCENVHQLLDANGGCWLIPDVNPDRMLGDTMNAVMGNSQLLQGIYQVRDKLLSRDDSQINWKNLEEIVQGLEEENFHVEVQSLWQDGLEMRVLEGLSEDQRQKLLGCWKNLNFIVATV